MNTTPVNAVPLLGEYVSSENMEAVQVRSVLYLYGI